MNDSLLAPAQSATLTQIQLKLFGPPQLSSEQQVVSLSRRQMRALLYRLAAAMQPVAREHLCFLLWPDTPESTARRHLTVLLNQLRQALPVPEVVLAQHDAILLDPSAVDVDTVALARAISAAASHRTIGQLAEAVELYTGPFLHGFSLPASPEFDAWADQERQSWERRYLDALALLVDGYAAQGAYGPAIEAAQRALLVDELAEDMHRRLMELYAASGDRNSALRQFERCVVALERELGVSPLPETRTVYEAVRDGHAVAHMSAGSLLAAATPRPQVARPARVLKVPAPTTPLLGRAEEIAQGSALLIDPTVRLLTLCGPGGSGKTRLALQIASDIAELFTDGALFVSLAALRDPSQVAGAIAGVCELKQTSTAAVAQYLQHKHLLLVLDNFEHLLEAAPTIGALLQAAPNLHILTTSRSALNVQGEHTLTVPPLPLPDLARLPAPDALSGIPSVALLLARTQALNPRFQLTHENAVDLAAICVQLDGLPLAIELAAARLKLLAPRDLLRRLHQRLAVLTTGARDLPDRQQTLRATIDWSYRLLDANQQIWLERCGIFAGGWTLAAAEGLHQHLGWPEHDPTEVLDALAALVDKSLVQVVDNQDGETRFAMLETIREFAVERLQERGSFEAVAQAHASYFCEFIEQARPHFHSPHVAEWSARVDFAHHNLRAALRYVLDQETGVEQALQISTTLYHFWHLRGHYGEGLQWLEQVLAKSADHAIPLRASVLSQAGFLATSLGRTEYAIELFEACIRLSETIDAPAQRAAALNGLGIIFNRAGDPRGIPLLEEATALSRALNHPPAQQCAMIRALANALVTDGSQIERGVVLYEEALQIAREHQLIRNISLIIAGLGEGLIFTGQYQRALPLLLEGLAIQQQLNNKPMLAWSFLFLGTLHYLQHEYDQAQQYFVQSLDVVAELGNLNSVPDTFEGMAGIAAARQQPARAATLLGAAESLRQTLKLAKSPGAGRFYDRVSAATRAQLAPAEFNQAWEVGLQLTLEQAIAEAKAIPS